MMWCVHPLYVLFDSFQTRQATIEQVGPKITSSFMFTQKSLLSGSHKCVQQMVPCQPVDITQIFQRTQMVQLLN